MNDRVLLQMREIHQRFPGVHALKGVDFDLYPGEIHALVGENGAGKSTLMHILAGVYTPDSGSIQFNDHPSIRLANEREAQELGIAIVYQERNLVESLSVAENVFFGRQPVNALGIIDYARMNAQTREILQQLELDVEPRTRLSRLSPAQQQMVEIAKALSLDAKLLILDEPTAALTDTEIAVLFRVLKRLKAHGVGIIYISHRLREIFELADRITVLKDGEYRGTFDVGATNSDELISRMVGRTLITDFHSGTQSDPDRHPALEVRNLSDATRVQDISFCVWPGEIVAFSGLVGAGRTELALTIFGATKRKSGEIWVNGERRRITSPRDAIDAGIGYVPEDRRHAGLFLDMSVAKNIVSAKLDRFGFWWLNETGIRQLASEFRERLHIATPSVLTRVANLSGGNQQKVVLSRWLLVNPTILIVDEPTHGIDVGAKSEVHGFLRELANQGTAIVLISSELPEILAVADRIIVMREGRISGELSAAEATEEKILRYASTLMEKSDVS